MVKKRLFPFVLKKQDRQHKEQMSEAAARSISYVKRIFSFA